MSGARARARVQRGCRGSGAPPSFPVSALETAWCSPAPPPHLSGVGERPPPSESGTLREGEGKGGGRWEGASCFIYLFFVGGRGEGCGVFCSFEMFSF